MYEDITAETVLTLVRGSWIKNKNDGQTYEIASFSPEHNGYEVLYNGVTFNISGTFVYVRVEDLIENYQVRTW